MEESKELFEPQQNVCRAEARLQRGSIILFEKFLGKDTCAQRLLLGE